MLLFFHGPDSFRISQKIRDIKEKFATANPGSIDVLDLHGKDIVAGSLKSQILAMPLFSKTRLIILRDFISGTKVEVHAELISIIDKIPKTTNVVVSESLPDKRLKIYKSLIKNATIQEFKSLDRSQLLAWLDEFVTHCKIEPQAKNFLADNLGGNLWLASNILTKLETFLLDKPENERVITLTLAEEELAKLSNDSTFDLIDAYLSKNQNRSFSILKKLLDAGENPFYLFSMLASGVKNLILIKDASEQNTGQSQAYNKNSGEIASYTKLHPFVVSKNLNLASRQSMQNLVNLYQEVTEADTLTKYGIIKPELALEMLLAGKIEAQNTMQAISLN